MNRQLLEQPFTADQIKQREGGSGRAIDYIEGHSVIQRLNDAFESAWSFEIISHEIHQDEVVVIGKLTAWDLAKSQFGSSRITRNRDTKDIVSLADDMKAAATDALKKCATLFGVGLHMYAAKNGHGDCGKSHDTESDGRTGGNGSNGNTNGRLSSKQHSFLMKLANERKLTKKELNDRCVQEFGAVAGYLSRNDAAKMIEKLLAH
jgi:hypothetical protein